MKISNKQKLKNGTEFFYLPSGSGMGNFATWEKTDDGLLLRKIKVKLC
jgi:hypothetical protein